MAKEEKQNILSEKDTKKKLTKKVNTKEETQTVNVVPQEINEIEELKRMFLESMEQNKSLKEELDTIKESVKNIGLESNIEVSETSENPLDILRVLASSMDKGIEEDKDYEVSCNEISGVFLTSRNGEVSIYVPYSEVITISKEDLKILFRSISNKKFFEKGIVEFLYDEDYKDFKLIKRKNISDEHILEVFETNDINKIKKEVKDLTNGKKDRDVTHALFFKIINLERSNKLNFLNRNIVEYLEQYFERNFKDGKMILSTMDRIH